MRDKFSGALIALLDREAEEKTGLAVRIQKALRRMIAEGAIRETARLPSTRTLSADLGVARETIEAAYRQLETEGFVTRRHGSGTFVAPLERELAARGAAARRGARSALRPQTALSRRGKEIARRGGVVDQTVALPFAAAMPDVKPFPAELWRQFTARALRDGGAAVLMYGEAQGHLPLREEIAAYLAAHRGVRCNASQVLVLASSQQALSLVATLLSDPGDPIAVEDPGYHGAKSAFAAAGASLLPIPVDEHGLQVARLRETAARAVYVTPSHQYPLGVSLSLERRLALIEWAERNRGWIIEDDYDSEYRYDGRPLAAIQGLDPGGRVLYTGTFSKVLFPSLRLAYLVVPQALVPAFVTARTLMDGQSPLLPQVVLARFMTEGQFTGHIRRMRPLYRARRDAFLSSFQKHLSAFASAQAPAGGLQISCHLKPGWDEARTVAIAAKGGVELPTLSRLYLGGEAKPGWLMGFAALTPADIDAAMRRLGTLLAQDRRP